MQRFVLLLAAFAATILAQDQDSQLVAHFRAGQQAAAAHQFDRAIAEFRAVLKLDPTVVQARANLGLMYYSTGKYDAAASELLKVTRDTPDLLPGQLFLGLSLLNLGKPEQAVASLQKALHLDPNNTEGRRAILECYLQSNNYQQATEQIRLLEQQPADEETLYTIARAYLEMGRSLTSRFARQYPSSAWAHRLAGDLASDRSDWREAVDSYRQALAIDPQMNELHSPLAKALRALGQPDGNEEALVIKGQGSKPTPCQLEGCEKLLAKKPEAEDFYRLIRIDTALGNAYFTRLQSSFPDSARAHQVQAEIDRLRQDFSAALAEFQVASQKRSDDAELHRDTGEMLLLRSQVNEADHELRRSAELSPGNPQTEYLLAQVALKRDDLEAAVLHLKKALQRDPTLAEIHALLGTTYMHLDEPRLAIPELETARSIDYHGDLNFQLYRAYKQIGNPSAAEKALARSKEIRKNSLQSAVSKISGENTVTSR
jgi:tetratricopeptide (TPR) repeat protein